MASPNNKRTTMETENKYYILANARQPIELDPATWSNLDDLMHILAHRSGTRRLGKQYHKIVLESYRVPKGYFADLNVDGIRTIPGRTVNLFDLQTALQKHSGMHLGHCETVIKSAKSVYILLLPNPYTAN